MKQSYKTKNHLRLASPRVGSGFWDFFAISAPMLRNTLSMLLLLTLGLVQFSYAQTKTVTGTITDASGETLPGVSVYIKGTTRGTITDFDGKFQLEASRGETLVFQSIGFTTQEVIIAEQASIDIQLADDITGLEEIVVVGYGTQRKKDLTGSVASLDSEDFNPGPITSPLQQINGKVAGVNINQVGSEPGIAPSIRIRGITSLIGGSDPLVVVDGIQGDLGLLNSIPPSEIESMDILKDASATAIYGSRGAAGVLLVTTKSGKEGRTTVEYSGVFSVESVANKFDMLSASEYRQATAERGITGFDQGGNTDWQEEILQTGYTQNHTIAFGGGTEKLTFRASATAILQDGIVENSGFDNYIGRVQAVQRALNDKLKLTYNLNLSITERDFNGPATVGTAIITRPTNPVFDENGDYFIDNTLFSYTNPVARAREIIDTEEINSLFASMRADYEIIEGLTASVFGSWRRGDRAYEQYQSRIATDLGRDNNGQAVRNTNRFEDRLLDLSIDYRKTIGDHNFGITAIYEWQKNNFEGNGIRGIGFPNDDLGAGAIQNASSFPAGAINSFRGDRTLVSFLGRVDYSFDDRYLFTATFRRDGSSVFGANNKWVNFPSISVAWRLSEEAFMEGVSFINNLKIRAGFGVTGNQQGLGPLNSVQLARNTGNAFFGGELIPNFAIVQNANPDLKWETREMYNAGIDFALMNNKISGTIDYFRGTTTDLLFDYNVPVPPFPFDRIKANVGEVLNEGLEIYLNYQVINNNDWSVNLAANFSTIRTRVENLSGSIGFAGENVNLNTDFVPWGGADIIGVGGQNNDMAYLIAGQALGTFYLFRHAGIDDSGQQIVDDVNGNGQIDQGVLSTDRYIAGQALPKWSMAFTPNVSYKNFDLSLVLRGAFGQKIYNVRRAQLSLLNRLGQNNLLRSALSTGVQNIAETAATDLWLEDGDFVRLENLTIGYNFDTKGWGAVKRMRLSFTANNLFVISGYSGIDPEVNVAGGAGSGLDFGIYPRTRNFALGLNVTFQ